MGGPISQTEDESKAGKNEVSDRVFCSESRKRNQRCHSMKEGFRCPGAWLESARVIRGASSPHSIIYTGPDLFY